MDNEAHERSGESQPEPVAPQSSRLGRFAVQSVVQEQNTSPQSSGHSLGDQQQQRTTRAASHTPTGTAPSALLYELPHDDPPLYSSEPASPSVQPAAHERKKSTEKRGLCGAHDSFANSSHMGSLGNFALYDEDAQARPRINKILDKVMRQYNPTSDPIRGNDSEEAAPKAGGAQLGTLMGVYLPTIQNIFGVILFIRMAWIVGCAGTGCAFVIVFLCCLTTMLTAFSMSAIATNGVVPAGGAYFMISRSLGPEFGGAVGLLFYLATTFGSAMYILGAVEILIVYITQVPSTMLGFDTIADPNQPDDRKILFKNMRIYGTLFLTLMGGVVFIGVKYVNKLASFFLVCVIVSIITIYAGVINLAIGPKDVNVCLIGDKLLPSPPGWNGSHPRCVKETYEDDFCIKATGNETVPDCNNWYEKNNVRGYPVIRGFSGDYSSYNFDSKMMLVEQDIIAERVTKQGNVTDTGVTGGKAAWITQSISSFMIFMAIFFPSVTGIMAGSNRSGDLADPSASIPTGTIAAITTTSVVYLSTIVLLGATVDNVLLRDKFGASINQGLVMAQITWPKPQIMLIGSFLSSIGAGLQSLTGAPRLLQAIAKDGVMPFLKPLAKGKANGEPSWSLLVTMLISEVGILIADLDAVAPLITIFFLSCYMFVNFACALQTFIEAPSWRPRFRFYHWSLSTLGVVMCISMCFITSWYYTLIVLIFAGSIYKYIEYKGAEQEWGDGLKGLQMSTARYALLRLEQGPPHTKNWRPQILVLAKLENESLKFKSKAILNFCHQLKAGKGFFQLATVIEGDILDPQVLAKSKAAENYLKQMLESNDLKGFTSVLVNKCASDGISGIVQTAGLGGLRHNTVVCGWPDRWKSNPEKYNIFLNTIRHVNATNNALLVPKNIDQFPDCPETVSTTLESRTKSGEAGKGVTTGASMNTIDVWWIVHDGGLLMLLPHLLRQHKVWKFCRIRIFTVAQMEDNSIKMKSDLTLFLYHLRIEAEIEIVELDDSDISAYTYERTMVMEQRVKLLRDIQSSSAQSSPKIRHSSKKHIRDPTLIANQHRSQTNLNDIEDDVGPPDLQSQATWMPGKRAREVLTHAQEADLIGLEPEYTSTGQAVQFSGSTGQAQSSAPRDEDMANLLTVKPSQSNVKRMHNAVKLNEVILSKSHAAALVILNLPSPPRHSHRGARDSAYMEFLEVLTEGLERVLLIRGSGREVITMYS